MTALIPENLEYTLRL